MIVDTGCKYNIISSKLYQSQFTNYKLNTTEKHFTVYGQKEPLKCKGYFNATIRVPMSTLFSVTAVPSIHAEAVTKTPVVSESAKFRLEWAVRLKNLCQLYQTF